jgi:predicted AAA+ superfamily ATPase
MKDSICNTDKVQLDARLFNLRRVRFAASALAIYKDLRRDVLINDLCVLLEYMDSDTPDLFWIIDLYSSLVCKLFKVGTGIRKYIVNKLLHSENPFSIAAETKGAECLKGAMAAAVENDLAQLQILSSVRPDWIRALIMHLCKKDEVILGEVMRLPLWADDELTSLPPTTPYIGHDESGLGLKDAADTGANGIKELLMGSECWPDCAKELAEFHRKFGSGIFSRYRALVWRHVQVYGSPEEYQDNLTQGNVLYTDEGFTHGSAVAGVFVGVGSLDPVRFSDLISYGAEREDIIQNTLQFLDGKPANNILLYGDRGTGKSTTVKALVNEYHARGLRMIEVPKRQLGDFPYIIRQLVGRNLKFILFIDDLAFEDNEENYTALKAALEGGLESKPDNVLIYATSNRKHLIKERFSDRSGLSSGNIDDEVRAADTMQEKLSLSDRFGMTVVFSSPDKRRYLEIAEGLVKKRGLNVDSDYIGREAMKWELRYNGRSPRTARQFVDWLEGHLSSENN